MNTVSALLRVICGGVILLFVWMSWSKNKAAVAAGEPLQLFGQTIDAGAGTINVAYVLIAVIALGLVVMGVLGLIGGKK